MYKVDGVLYQFLIVPDCLFRMKPEEAILMSLTLPIGTIPQHAKSLATSSKCVLLRFPFVRLCRSGAEGAIPYHYQ
jgi:hypothetical protein